MEEQTSISRSEERVKYFVRFFRLRYEYDESELPRHSYIKVLLDGKGRHLRRNWFRADGVMATREELQYDADGKNIRVETFDAEGARKGHALIHHHGDGRTSFHRFDAGGMPTEILEEKRNDRGFLLWEHYQSVTEYGSSHETIRRVEYDYPEPGVREGSFFSEEERLSHLIIDRFNENSDLVTTERYDDAGKLISRSDYKYDEMGRVLLRKDFDGAGKLTGEENYQN